MNSLSFPTPLLKFLFKVKPYTNKIKKTFPKRFRKFSKELVIQFGAKDVS